MLSFQSPIARQVLAKLGHIQLYLLLGARSWPFLTSRPIISLPNNYLSSSPPSDIIFPFRNLVLPRRYPIPKTLSFATCIGVYPVSPVSPQRQTNISTISMPSARLHLGSYPLSPRCVRDAWQGGIRREQVPSHDTPVQALSLIP